MQVDVFILYIVVAILGAWIFVRDYLIIRDSRRIWKEIEDNAIDISHMKARVSKIVRAIQNLRDKEGGR